MSPPCRASIEIVRTRVWKLGWHQPVWVASFQPPATHLPEGRAHVCCVSDPLWRPACAWQALTAHIQEGTCAQLSVYSTSDSDIAPALCPLTLSPWTRVKPDGVFFPLGPVKVQVAQSCPALCDPTDYTVHGVLQAGTLQWVAVPFSRGSSQPRDRTQVSHIAGRFFTS